MSKPATHASHRAAFVVLIATLSVGVSHAAQGPTEDGLWYYEIGGAEPVSAPANPSVVSVTLGGSAQLGLGYSCGKFDPVLAVTNSLNNIKSGVDDMMNAMTAAASSAIAALPALILQRANPGLYDLFQNALLKAEETMQLATKSCEQMEAEIAKGKNPYADLITISKGNDWKRQMGIGGNDAVTAKGSVEASNGDSGVPWIGGPAGGAGQPLLQFTGDIVQAGYNINMNRPITATGPVPPASATRLSEVWPTPVAARNWVVDVGPAAEALYRVHRGHGRVAEPGERCDRTDARQSRTRHRTGRSRDPPGRRGDPRNAGNRTGTYHRPAGCGNQHGPNGGESALCAAPAALRPPGTRGLRD